MGHGYAPVGNKVPELAPYVGLLLGHHFVRIAYEGAIAIRSASPGMGVPELAALLSGGFAQVTERARHLTKMLDNTKKTYADVLSEFAAELKVWQSAFMNDAGEEAQRITHSLMVPQPYQYFTETVEPIVPEMLGVPAAYVLSEQDIALPPGEYGWARFAERLGVTPQSAPGSHEACFTQPAALAEALLKA